MDALFAPDLPPVAPVADAAHAGVAAGLLVRLASPSVDAFALLNSVTRGQTVEAKIRLCASLVSSLANSVAAPVTQLSSLLVVVDLLRQNAPPEGIAIADAIFASVEKLRVQLDDALSPATRRRLVACLANARSRLQLEDAEPLYFGAMKGRLSNTTCDLLPSLSTEVVRQAELHGLVPRKLWTAVMDALGEDYGPNWSARDKRSAAVDKVRIVAEAQAVPSSLQQVGLVTSARGAPSSATADEPPARLVPGLGDTGEGVDEGVDEGDGRTGGAQGQYATRAPSVASLLIRSGVIAPFTLVSNILTARAVIRKHRSSRSEPTSQTGAGEEDEEDEGDERAMVEGAVDEFLQALSSLFPDAGGGVRSRRVQQRVEDELVERIRSL
ncbi:hypothetical protein JCM9279_007002 [Rhodotorula babjevae]